MAKQPLWRAMGTVKKLLNAPETVVPEALAGLARAHR